MKRQATFLLIFFFLVLNFNQSSQIFANSFTKDKYETENTLVSNIATKWYSEYIKGSKVGYSSNKQYSGILNGQQVIITEVNTYVRIQRLNSSIDIKNKTTYYESLTGQPIKFVQVTNNGSTKNTTTIGEIENNSINLTIESYGKKDQRVININSNILFPFAEEKLFNNPNNKTFEYSKIIPEMGIKSAHVKVEYIGNSDVQLLDRIQNLDRFKITTDILPSVITYEWRDTEGTLFKSESNLLNSTSFLVSENEAKKLTENKPIDFLTSSLIYTNKRIPDPQGITSAYYIIKIKQGDIQPLFIQDNRQNISKASTEQLNIEVKSFLPDYLNYNIPFNDNKLNPYLQSNSMMPKDDYKIQKIVSNVVRNKKNAYLIAKNLEKWVHKNINKKNYEVGLANALETIETKSGDCTEHAILLATLCRAAGIPSKVVVGLTYTNIPGSEKGAFVYHMWTEVFVGKWIQLDATLQNKNVVDSTHIAFSKFSLNDPEDQGTISALAANALGNLNIEIVYFNSKASSLYDISSQALNKTIKINLKNIRDKATISENATIKKINIENFFDTKAPITKFNLSGVSNTSPLLESYKGYFTKGLAKYSEGDIKTSMKYFKRAASIVEPDNAKKLYDLGVRLFGIMYYDLGKQQFDKAINLNDQLWSGMAKTYLEDNNPKGDFNSISELYNMEGFSYANFTTNHPAAKLMYEKALEISPNFDSALFNLGNIYLLDGDFEQALEKIKKAISINPKNPEYFYSLGKVYENQGNINSALSSYEKAINFDKNIYKDFMNRVKFEITKIKAEKLIQKNPNNQQAYILVGNTALESNLGQQAKNAFIKALSINPNNAEAHTGLGTAYLFLGLPLQAEEEFNKALKLNSSNFKALKGLGIINKKRLNLSNAINYFNKALRIKPKDTDIIVNLGQIYIKQNKLNEAIQVFSKSDSAESLYHLGIAYQKSNNIPSAIINFETATNIKPLDARSYTKLGEIYLNLGDLEKAKNYLIKSASLDTNNSETYYLLGLLGIKEQNIASAKENLISSYLINPNNVTVYRELYEIYSNANNLKNFTFPKPKYTPNTLEKDYLIKLLYLTELDNTNSIKFIDSILNNSQYGIYYMPNDLQSKFIIKKAYTNLLTNYKAIYNKAMELSPPEKLNNLNKAFLEYLWNSANLMNKRIIKFDTNAININPLNPKDSELINPDIEIQEALNVTVSSTESFKKELNKLQRSWDPISIDEILNDSGFNPKMGNELQRKNSSLIQKSNNSIEALKEQLNNPQTN